MEIFETPGLKIQRPKQRLPSPPPPGAELQDSSFGGREVTGGTNGLISCCAVDAALAELSAITTDMLATTALQPHRLLIRGETYADR